MTFENLLRTTVVAQFTASIGAAPVSDTTKLPANGTANWRFQMGQTKHNEYNASLSLVNTASALFYIDTQTAPDDSTSSDYIWGIQQAVANYIPPPVNPSDPITINGIKVYTIDPPNFEFQGKPWIRRVTCICDATLT